MISMLSVGAYKMYQKLTNAKAYGIFITHHKGGAGLLARLIKMYVEASTSAGIFLDVDELENLDNLFFTVRSNTENVWILLTEEVLSRFWCAVEIVTADMNHVPLSVLQVSPKFNVGDEFLQNL